MADISQSFIHTLVQDVEAGLKRVELEDNSRHRREAMRSIFAAIEGVVWIYRQHIHRVSKDLDELSRPEERVLEDVSYLIGGNGELREHPRLTPLPAMVRFVAALAQRSCGAPPAEYGHVGWAKLKRTVELRNRLTHPKDHPDLHVSSKELSEAYAGFCWLLALTIEGMSAANEKLREFTSSTKEILRKLSDGDAEALAEYDAIKDDLENEE
jgi:hypothetical protein